MENERPQAEGRAFLAVGPRAGAARATAKRPPGREERLSSPLLSARKARKRLECLRVAMFCGGIDAG